MKKAEQLSRKKYVRGKARDDAPVQTETYKIEGRTFIVESKFSDKAHDTVTAVLTRLMRLDSGELK
jgi:hypothetical protein